MKLSCRHFVFITFMLLVSLPVFSQSVSINTDGSAANASAMLDVKSSTKGLLIPRLTKAEKNAVAAPATGLLIYQTGPDSAGFYYYQNLRWNWLADNNKNDSSYWSLHGNSNMRPPQGNQFDPIDFANDTYLGSYESKDISMIAGGNELLRIKQVPLGGRIGFSNRNPEYALDIRLSDPSPTSEIVGMRIIPNQLFNPSTPVNVNKGIVFGNDVNNIKETVIWNYANNIDAAIRIGFDMFNPFIRPALNINQYGLGVYQRTPHYALDMHSFSQFAPASNVTNKNGVRITFNNQENQPDEVKGLFMGVDRNSFKSYLWNYADGVGGNSPDKAIYFGVGGDMDYSLQRPTMEMQDGKIIMGHVTDPTFFFPSTINIQTDYATGVAKNGLSIMKHLVNGQESGYFGTDANDNLNVYKYGSGSIYLGSPLDYTVSISPSNYVGIKVQSPTAPLQFQDIYENKKLVLHNNNYGTFPGNDHDFYGFGVNAGSLRYQVPRNSTAHIFYAGNNAGTASNELMRITGDGFVGIGNNNPQAPLQLADGPVNRKIVLEGFANNDHNFLGIGNSPDGGFRYQVPYGIFDHVFFKGDNGGSTSTELFRIAGSGDVGVGASFPTAYGHIGTNRIMEIRNSLSGAGNVQSHLILSTYGQSGLLGGISWVGINLSGEQRTGFIANAYETANQTKLSFYTRSNAGILNESFYIQGTGNAWLQGTLTQASDARLKQNIRPLSSVLSKIEQMNGYTYNWINDQRDNEEQVGLLAQEVQKNYPQLVNQNDKGELSVNYSGLVPVLLEGIKEQQQQIEILRQQNLQQQLQIEAILKKVK